MQFEMLFYHLWKEGNKFLNFTAGSNKVCNYDQFYDDLLRSSAFKSWNSSGLRLNWSGHKFPTEKAWLHRQIIRLHVNHCREKCSSKLYTFRCPQHSFFSSFLSLFFSLLKIKTQLFFGRKARKGNYQPWRRLSEQLVNAWVKMKPMWTGICIPVTGVAYNHVLCAAKWVLCLAAMSIYIHPKS